MILYVELVTDEISTIDLVTVNTGDGIVGIDVKPSLIVFKWIQHEFLMRILFLNFHF